MFHSKLVINQIIPEDDAIYQCQAENHQGSVLSMARLIVVMSEDRPSAPRNIRADTVSSSAILLAWERPLYNADKVIAYSVHYMKAEGRSSRDAAAQEWKHLQSQQTLQLHPFILRNSVLFQHSTSWILSSAAASRLRPHLSANVALYCAAA